MKNFKGTPGPWFFAAKHDDCEVRYVCKGENYNRCNDVCTLYTGSAEEQYANANLIAAAPELLEALQLILSVHGEMGDSNVWSINKSHEGRKARAAIDKALGEQS